MYLAWLKPGKGYANKHHVVLEHDVLICIHRHLCNFAGGLEVGTSKSCLSLMLYHKCYDQLEDGIMYSCLVDA